mgnify:CR=1
MTILELKDVLDLLPEDATIDVSLVTSTGNSISRPANKVRFNVEEAILTIEV